MSKELHTKLSDEEWEILEKRYSKELKALEKVNKVLESCYEYEKKTGKNATVYISKEPLIEIQQALETKSKKELAFDVIKEKRVDVDLLGSIIRDYEEEDCCMIYNEKVCDEEQLTEEEFELLKEVLE